MTAPVSHGYPDWNRVAALADTLLLNTGFVNTVSDPTDYEIGFVGNYPAVGMELTVSGQTHNFDFAYFEDAAFTTSFSTYRFTLTSSGSIARRVVPVLGPYLRVSVKPVTVTGTHSIRLWSAPRSAMPNGTNPIASVLISTTATNVVAAATNTQNSAFAWPGMAHWVVTSAATSWRILLQAVSSSGAFVTIASAQGAANQTVSMLVFLPPSAIRTQFTNNGAAAANYDTYVSARVIEAGA